MTLPPGASRTDPVPIRAGIGLRAEHYERVDEERPEVGWLEVHPENYFGAGGAPHHYLDRLRAKYPLSFHGVGLSLGSADALDRGHLDRLAELVEVYRPALVSEHLSWSSINGVFFNDLLPVPYTRESLDNFQRKVDAVQSRLGRRILLENPSSYLAFDERDYNETEFLNILAQRTGCGILLDVNNVYVSACNHGFDADDYIAAIEPTHVGEIHLAGHAENTFAEGRMLIDSHDRPISDDVWALYQRTLDRIGARPTLIEWDTDLPALEVLVEHAVRADDILSRRHAVAA